ncbi:uncharacterized protein LOC142165898 [Nicotiana tabacum]|uniref:Uncharacterized protein LOC142165898 n=1 Tax=Nicotiana tabacum TaxID=4097 RepID=A0AC58S5X8_TOBAC
MVVVLEFFRTGEMLKVLNHTVITVIPKSSHATNVGAYRTIAGCNTVYKVISKMMCNRLRLVLPKLISESQSAFVAVRTIVQNILICQDLVRLYNRKNTTQSCLIKTDLKKAYDYVEWTFMEEMLHAMNFPQRFIKWIMACITTTRYSIALNGGLYGITRFVLSNWIQKGKLPFKYLGVPISAKKLSSIDYEELVDKMTARIKAWTMKLKKSILCLESSVNKFSAITGTYLLVINLHTSKRCAKKNHCSIQKNFLWDGREQTNKVPLISWDMVCRPKEKRGLGINDCVIWNEAAIAKYVWNIAQKADNLWVKWADHIYIKGSRWKQYQPPKDCSWNWKIICSVKEKFKDGYRVDD